MEVLDAVCRGRLRTLRRLDSEVVIMNGERVAPMFTVKCVHFCIFNTRMRTLHGEAGVLEALTIILRNMVGGLRTDRSVYSHLHDKIGGYVTADIAELLLSHGANPDAINYRGRTALFHCTPAVARVLIRHRADVNIQDHFGQTAMFSSGPEFAKILLEGGADVNVHDNWGKTAIFSSGPEVTRMLLHSGANVNARDAKNRTPLFNAMPYMVDIFLKNGADVNAKDENDETPIFAAIRDWDMEKAQMLYENNANLYQVSNRTNQTAIKYAASMNRNALNAIILHEEMERRSEAFALSGAGRPGKDSGARILGEDLVQMILRIERNL